MKGFLTNWELKVLAVLSAIIFWFLVVGTENSFYTFPEQIPVKAFNLADDLVVSGNLPSVSLRLKINNRESIKNLTANDFSPFIDLEGQGEGEFTARVEVSSKSSDISVAKVDPSEIKVKIEKMNKKEVPVDYKIEGDVAEGFQVNGVELSGENVIVKGSQSSLNDVFKATALIALDNNREDLNIKVPLVAYNSDGEVINDISFSKKEIDVVVKISPFRNQKILGVQPNIVGTPDSSVWIKSINVDPSYIIASGDQEALNGLDFLSTQDINVDGLDKNKTFTVSIANLPDGIEVENDSIDVSIEVKKYDSANENVQRITLNVPLFIKKFKSVQSGSKLDPSSLTLIVEGTKENLNKISSSLRLDLDISGVSASGDTMEINSYDLNLPSGVSVVSLTPQSVKVTWR